MTKVKLKRVVFSFAIKDGKFEWKNLPLFETWMEKYEDCVGYARLTPKGKTAIDKMRRFYRGAVVPLFAWYCNIDEHERAHEILKLEFNGYFIEDLEGEKVKVGRSTTKLVRTDLWFEFLEKIRAYFEEHSWVFPDSEDYKKWEDTPKMVEDKKETYLQYFIRMRGLKRN